MPFIPHTKEDVQSMLDTMKISSTDDLFKEIPKELQTANLSSIPPQLNEMELSRLMHTRAKQDESLKCFIGAGAYEHHIPAAVWEVASRGEFLTSYTPYQAEASQGTLQLLYEYQTMMASLMALDVSNASLYDGASALAEAILMSVRSLKKKQNYRIFVPKTVNPFYREVVKSIVSQQGIEIVEIDFSETTGQVDINALNAAAKDGVSALVIPQPNFFGVLEEVDQLTDWIHAHHGLAIGVVNPLAMSLLRPPGEWGAKGADIACGEGQPLGVPLASGGPYYGFLCCKQEFVRQLPGRIVGRTVDTEGRDGFVLTLQAREQHIRRAKATSNICTNQGLLVTASTIHMSMMGPEGLRQTALSCYENAELLKSKLEQIKTLKIHFNNTSFHEFVVELPKPAHLVLQELAKDKIQGGFDLGAYYPQLKNCLLICVTETKTEEDLDNFVNHLKNAISQTDYSSLQNDVYKESHLKKNFYRNEECCV